VSPVPVIIYNVPSRTGSNIAAETTLRIAHEVPNVIAIKEACRDFVQVANIIKGKPEGFLVISGDDVTALPFMALGGDGVISVIANALPAEFTRMINLCLKGDFATARPISFSLADIIDGIYADGSPSGIKAVLEMKGLCRNVVRLPLVKINKSLQNQLAQMLDELDKSSEK
jgi:4-hydroxy-tetrahydrodipicolinate synthase